MVLMVTGLSSMLSVQAASHGAGTDPAGELGEVVGGVQSLQRRAPLIAIDQVVPVRDQVVDRTAVVTERNAAGHAARRLPLDIAGRQRLDELAPGLEARLARLIAAIAALDFQKAGGLAHLDDYSAATAVAAARSAASSSSARR